MITHPPIAAALAAERRRDLLKQTDDDPRARAARQPARASLRTIRIRPVRPDDARLPADIFTRLSPASRYARFLSSRPQLTAAELRYFTDIDPYDHEALIALTRRHGDPVGAARFIRDHDDLASADVAIEVVDEWQNRGVGSLLSTRLTNRAQRVNVSPFTALVQADNLRARRLLANVGDITDDALDGGARAYRVTIRPQPRAILRAAFARRRAAPPASRPARARSGTPAVETRKSPTIAQPTALREVS